MGYRELSRKMLLAQILGKMTEDEKRTYMQLVAQGASHQEIMDALRQQGQQLGAISEKVAKQSWVTDFGSDVAANFLTDGIIWLGSRLLKRH